MDKLLIYTQIKQLKKRKFTNKQIAEQIGVCRQTVAKYAQMTDDELVTWMAGCQTRKQKLDKHHQMILDWLREYPNLTASQIHDWLEEQNIQNISESTVRRYVKQMKEYYQIMAEVMYEIKKQFLDLNHKYLLSLIKKWNLLGLKSNKYAISKILKYDLIHNPSNITLSPINSRYDIEMIYIDLSKIGLVNITN